MFDSRSREIQYGGKISSFLPVVYCLCLLPMVCFGERCRASCKELNRKKVGRSVRETSCTVYLFMAWTLCRIDQVLVGSILVRCLCWPPFLHLLTVPFLLSLILFSSCLVFIFRTDMRPYANQVFFFFSVTGGRHRHIGATYAAFVHRVRVSIHTSAKWQL